MVPEKQGECTAGPWAPRVHIHPGQPYGELAPPARRPAVWCFAQLPANRSAGEYG